MIMIIILVVEWAELGLAEAFRFVQLLLFLGAGFVIEGLDSIEI